MAKNCNWQWFGSLAKHCRGKRHPVSYTHLDVYKRQFQIRLNTSTNVISVVYDMSATTSKTAQVGLRGSTTDFNNLTSTISWAASSAGAVNTATMSLSGTAFPTTGLNYIWSPPLPCSSKPAGGTIASSVGAAPLCPSSAAILSISGSTSATGIVYAWDSSTVSSTGPWFTLSLIHI